MTIDQTTHRNRMREPMCPPWCAVSQADHAAELRADLETNLSDGDLVLHRSALIDHGGAPAASIDQVTRVDGSRYPGEQTVIYLNAAAADPGGLPLDVARELAHQVLALVHVAEEVSA